MTGWCQMNTRILRFLRSDENFMNCGELVCCVFHNIRSLLEIFKGIDHRVLFLTLSCKITNFQMVRKCSRHMYIKHYSIRALSDTVERFTWFLDATKLQTIHATVSFSLALLVTNWWDICLFFYFLQYSREGRIKSLKS